MKIHNADDSTAKEKNEHRGLINWLVGGFFYFNILVRASIQQGITCIESYRKVFIVCLMHQKHSLAARKIQTSPPIELHMSRTTIFKLIHAASQTVLKNSYLFP